MDERLTKNRGRELYLEMVQAFEDLRSLILRHDLEFQRCHSYEPMNVTAKINYDLVTLATKSLEAYKQVLDKDAE